MKWCLSLVVLLVTACAAEAQPIRNGHPQKTSYASPAEWPCLKSQGHTLIGVMMHDHVEPCIPYGAEITGPTVIKFTLMHFRVAGKRVVVYGPGVRDVQFGTPLPTDIPGLVMIPGQLVLDPAGFPKNGFMSARIYTRTQFDNGDRCDTAARFPVYSLTDPSAPPIVGNISDRERVGVATEVACTIARASGRPFGVLIMETLSHLPIAPVTAPFPIRVRGYTYTDDLAMKALPTPGELVYVLDPNLHQDMPGMLSGFSLMPPDPPGPELSVTVGPDQMTEGDHTLSFVWKEKSDGSAVYPSGVEAWALLNWQVRIGPGGTTPLPPPPPPAEVCGDGLDNDLDGLIDEGCPVTPPSPPPPPPPPVTSAWTTATLATDATGYVGVASDNGLVLVTDAGFSSNVTRVKRSTDSGETFGPWVTLPGSGTAYIENPIDIDGSLVLIAGVAATQTITDFCCARRVGAVVIWRSTDAGLTYTQQVIDPQAKALRLSIDADGPHALVAWMDYRRGVWDIVVARSEDGGLNWTTQTVALGTNAMGAQRPSVSLRGALAYLAWMDGRDDLPPCPNENRLLPVCTEIYGARSTDTGASWSTSRLTANTGYAGRPDVLVSGSAVDLAFDWRRTGTNNNDIGLLRSVDGGATFVTPTFIAGPHEAEQTHAVLASGGSFLQAILMDARSGDYQIREQVIGSASSFLSTGNEAPAMSTDASFIYAVTKQGGTMRLHRKSISTSPPPPTCPSSMPVLSWSGAALPLSFAPFTVTDANGCTAKVDP